MLVNLFMFGFIFSDVDVDKPDEKSIMTYVAQFLKQYPDIHSAGTEGQENEVGVRFSSSSDSAFNDSDRVLGMLFSRCNSFLCENN